MVHTDLQQNNILLGVEDEYILSDFEEAERVEPSPRKIDGQNTIYMSRELPIPKKHGRPVLSDFGEARFGQEDYSGDIQPFIYRAPEVALQMRWDSKVDIWSAGMLAWDLFENKHLFNAEDRDGKDSTEHHLAEMVALMGLPPKRFIQNSDTALRYFNEHGGWKGAVEIPAISLESAEENLQGRDKALFLDFMRKMLQWAPDERKSAKELLKDPWLRGPSSP